MIEAGERVTFPAVSRRALYRSLSCIPTQGSRVASPRHTPVQGEAGRDRAWRLPAVRLVTDQSLHADLANARDRVRRLTEELSVLRDRLARELGAGIRRGDRPRPSSLLGQLEEKVAHLEADNRDLHVRVTELEEALRESDETLAAARAIEPRADDRNQPRRRRRGPRPRRPPPIVCTRVESSGRGAQCELRPSHARAPEQGSPLTPKESRRAVAGGLRSP